MDIKAPKDKYSELTLKKIDVTLLERSIQIIKMSGLDYEFRTTFAPDLTADDILEIAKWIGGAKRFALQQYRKPDTYKGFIDRRLNLPPHTREEAEEAFEKVRAKFAVSLMRGF
jgi:pyruvate formate lyase activating enzyme